MTEIRIGDAYRNNIFTERHYLVLRPRADITDMNQVILFEGDVSAIALRSDDFLVNNCTKLTPWEAVALKMQYLYETAQAAIDAPRKTL